MQDVLAEKVLGGEIADGSHVLIDAGEDGLILTPAVRGELVEPSEAAE